MHKQIIEQTISDRKIKENIRIYIWIDLFAYICMHICPTYIVYIYMYKPSEEILEYSGH